MLVNIYKIKIAKNANKKTANNNKKTILYDNSQTKQKMNIVKIYPSYNSNKIFTFDKNLIEFPITFKKTIIKDKNIIGKIENYKDKNHTYKFNKFGINFYKNMIIAVGENINNKMVYSYNGSEFFPMDSIDQNLFDKCKSICWNGNKFVAIANGHSSYSSIGYSYDGFKWYGLGNKLFGDSAESICWNGNMFIIVGGNEYYEYSIAYSYDGINWITVDNKYLNLNKIIKVYGTLKSVYWNGNLFLATGITCCSTFYYLYSKDGISWDVIFSNILEYGNDIISNEKINIITGKGNENCIYYTENMKKWTSVKIKGEGKCIAYNEKIFVLSYLDLEKKVHIIYSNDGINWNNAELDKKFNIEIINKICWCGDRFIAVGTNNEKDNTMCYSYDGIKWFIYENSGKKLQNISGICWNGNSSNISSRGQFIGYTNFKQRIIALGGSIINNKITSVINYSDDGFNWNSIDTNNNLSVGLKIIWNGDIYVATGLDSLNTIIYSNDGINWKKDTNGNEILKTGMTLCWNGKIFVIGGQGKFQFGCSYDGIKWFPIYNNIFTQCNGICWNGNFFIAVGYNLKNNNTIAKSINGIDWTIIKTKKIFGKLGGNKIIWNIDKFIVIGDGTDTENTGTIAFSYDGISWYRKDSNFTYGNDLCSNGQTTIIVGNSNLESLIMYSNDNGYNWSKTKSDIFKQVNSICWDGEKFIAVGNIIGFSFDGINWNKIQDNICNLYGICSNSKIGTVNIDNQIILDNEKIILNNDEKENMDKVTLNIIY